jgi:ketosteroid isomerase-like protein
MTGESGTPDPLELTRRLSEAEGVDPTMSFYGPDSVYDMSHMGMGVFEGEVAIRGFLEDWHRAYEEYEDEMQELRDFGNGIVFAVVRQNARPAGSPPDVRLHDVYGYVFAWADGKVARITPYPDVDEARAAAERLGRSKR